MIAAYETAQPSSRAASVLPRHLIAMQPQQRALGALPASTHPAAVGIRRQQRPAHPRQSPLSACKSPTGVQHQQPIGWPIAERQSRPGDLQVCSAGSDAYSYAPSSYGDASAPARLSEPARAALARATSAMRRYGWLAFWIQLVLSVISGVILLFSVAFTSQTGPKASLYLTVVGILAGFFSTFWAFGYQRTSMRMQEYLDGADVAKIKKQTVIETVTKGVVINLVGMGATVIGISTLVGLLVAKTLSNASVNPFMGAAGGYNPVLALDVFLVQAATNTLLGHFLSLLCSLWLLNVIGEGRGLKFQRQQHIQRLKKVEEEGVTGRSMSGSLYRIKGSGTGGWFWRG